MYKVLVKDKKSSSVLIHDDYTDKVSISTMRAYTSLLRSEKTACIDIQDMFLTKFNIEELALCDVSLVSLCIDVFYSRTKTWLYFKDFCSAVNAEIARRLLELRKSKKIYTLSETEKFTINMLTKACNRIGVKDIPNCNLSSLTHIEFLKLRSILKDKFRVRTLTKSGIDMFCDINTYYLYMDKAPSEEDLAVFLNKYFDFSSSYESLLNKLPFIHQRFSSLIEQGDTLGDCVVEYSIPGLVPDEDLIAYIKAHKEWYKSHAIESVSKSCRNKKSFKKYVDKLYVKQFQFLLHNDILLITVSVRGRPCQV